MTTTAPAPAVEDSAVEAAVIEATAVEETAPVLVEQDSLVEDVSIDGMCGVY